MKHSESDVDQQISIQGIYLSAFWNYVGKRERSFMIYAIRQICCKNGTHRAISGMTSVLFSRPFGPVDRVSNWTKQICHYLPYTCMYNILKSTGPFGLVLLESLIEAHTEHGQIVMSSCECSVADIKGMEHVPNIFIQWR